MAVMKFVVVCSDGTSYDTSRREQSTQWGKTKTPRYDLEDLLDQGWVAIRETGMGGGDHNAFALVVLRQGGT